MPEDRMTSQVVADAVMDPWCLVPLVTGGRVLFGFALQHPRTGGLSWVRSTPVVNLDVAAERAATESGRHYELGRRMESASIPLEGEEAEVAYALLFGSAAMSIEPPPIITDRQLAIEWITACKMARHLGIVAPAHAPAAVEAFTAQNMEAYLLLRQRGTQPDAVATFSSAPFPCELLQPRTRVSAMQQLQAADPAGVAAGCLLRHALEAAGTSYAEAGRDGAVCLVVLPEASWATIVRDEWREQARRGARYRDGDEYRDSDGDIWVAWVPQRSPRPAGEEIAADSFAKAISSGCHCIGIAAGVDWLPSDLVEAADHRLTLPQLTADDVTLIANRLGGHEPTQRLSDEQAARLTPRLLRLAQRRDQTADLYVLKLRGLLDRLPSPHSASTAAANSPRKAPSLERLAGMDEAVAFGMDVARDIKAFKQGEIGWDAVDKGALLSGPPGCGKTLFASAMATTCGVPLVTASYSEWLATGTGHQGDLLLAMRHTFRSARDQAPCILFLDEIDSFPDRGKITHRQSGWEIQVVNALLGEIDGVEGLHGVVMLAACNHPSRLDPALVRSGRLDRHLRVTLPDRAALARILRDHLGTDLASEDLSGAALLASGSSGADCERLVRGARRRARSAGRDMVMAELLAEISGTEDHSPEDQWISAVHEAGHAVATCVLSHGSLGAVSLRGAGASGGMTSAKFEGSVFIRSGDLRHRLVIALAGRAAEEAMFGMPSSGAGGPPGSDLAKATHLVVISLTAWGLDKSGGLVWQGLPDINAVPELLAMQPELANRVRIVLDDAYAAASQLVGSRITAVTALAHALVARRFLDGPDAEAIVRRHPGDGEGGP
jgi:cell division protease FtsH